ncbi:MAG: UbiA family prenyltransferase [Candidatus Limnocylindrales bacterium]
MAPPLSALRLVHPFPSLLNSVLVMGLALLAGADAARATLLAGAMLGMQFCIGTVNDLFDESVDRAAKPWKPIPSGVVTRRAAWAVALAAGGGGSVLAAAAGALVALMWLVMLSCGLLYDMRLKATAWAWLCFSVAFSILPVYAWFGAAGQLPPRLEMLLPLAALAGPMIQLSNGLADLERDAAAGLTTLATRLGRRGSLAVVLGLLGLIHGIAWLTITNLWTLFPDAAASGLALAGFSLSAARRPNRRELGWMVQASAIALLAFAWLLAGD